MERSFFTVKTAELYEDQPRAAPIFLSSPEAQQRRAGPPRAPPHHWRASPQRKLRLDSMLGIG
jgi:hypothetical protein